MGGTEGGIYWEKGRRDTPQASASVGRVLCTSAFLPSSQTPVWFQEN